MKLYFLILISAILISCSKNSLSGIENAGNAEKITINLTNSKSENNNHNIESKTIKKDNSEILDCSDPSSYEIQEDGDENFHFINFVQKEKVVQSFKTPTGSTMNGFGLNWARKTNSGFEISIEYGSRFYYEKNFKFVCKNRQLYLTEIQVWTFDKNNPENSGKGSKKNIKPNVSLSNFEITDYITEFGK